MSDHAHVIRDALNVASAQNYVHVAVDAAIALDALLARTEKLEQALREAANRIASDDKLILNLVRTLVPYALGAEPYVEDPYVAQLRALADPT